MSTYVTIFTPTYNRGHLLPRLYNSLVKLDYDFFEWVIVDDGSTDDTNNVVLEFIKENKIKITYQIQENSGKHVAINRGVTLAKGELFFIVDSDDWLPMNSLKLIQDKYKSIKHSSKIIGVVGKRLIVNKDKTSINLHKKEFLSSLFDFRNEFQYEGDMAEVVKTEVMKNYPFPIFENEKFCTEALIWNRMSKEFKFLYFDDFIYNCEYQEDGLTSKYWQLLKNNPKGSLLYYKELLEMPLSEEMRLQILRGYRDIARGSGDSKLKIIKDLGVIDFLRCYNIPI